MPEPDLSEFLKLSRPKKKPCLVGVALDALPAADRAALVAALAQAPDVITAGAIVQWLAARGHQANLSAVTHHRRGACRCDA